jgi:hypothetical protein
MSGPAKRSQWFVETLAGLRGANNPQNQTDETKKKTSDRRVQ